jgi:hypothetical protein
MQNKNDQIVKENHGRLDWMGPHQQVFVKYL